MNIKLKFLFFVIILLAPFSILSIGSSAQVDSLNWEFVISQDWERPERLDSFIGVHPRLLLNEEKIETLRNKIKTTHKEIWEVVKEKADILIKESPPSDYNRQGDMRSAGRGIPWQALAYVMTENPVYLEGARKWMMAVCSYPNWENNRSLAGGECLFGVSIGYDWLYNDLTVEERNYIRKKLIYQAEAMINGPPVHHDRWLANHNHVEHNGLAAAGFVLYDEVPEAINWIRYTDLVFRTIFKILSHDGSSDEGHQYWAYSTESLLHYAEAARDLLGEDFYDCPGLKNAPYFIIFSTIPDFDVENCVMSYGDSHRDYDERKPTHILYRLAAEYNNGYAQWLANEMVKRGFGQENYSAWNNLIWYNENIQPNHLSELPAFWYFDNIGWVTTRSSWDEDAVMIGFKCGPFHGHKLQRYYERRANENLSEYISIGGGHVHSDVNNFQIYAYGKWLAIDPGYERPKWTKNHNTILVNGKGQLGEGLTWFDRKTVLNARASSAILKAESHTDFDYIIGDAGSIYPESAGLIRFYRHLIYIKPDFIIIVDELKANDAALFEWLLHTESDIGKHNNNYCMVKNGDVVMDAHFLLPERVTTTVNGRILKISPEITNKALIVTVLHPRRIADTISSASVESYQNSMLELFIQDGRQKKKIQLDLANQKVNIFNKK